MCAGGKCHVQCETPLGLTKLRKLCVRQDVLYVPTVAFTTFANVHTRYLVEFHYLATGFPMHVEMKKKICASHQLKSEPVYIISLMLF